MNSLAKILILSTLLVFVTSSASAAVFSDLNAWDANLVRHANKGEDFNIVLDSDTDDNVSTDFNYIIALSYGGKYVDLNVQVVDCDGEACGNAAGWMNDGGDANVEKRTIDSDGVGPCAQAGDVNILVMNRLQSDTNTFNIKLTVPTASENSVIDHMVGREVTVEMWEIGTDNECVDTEAAASARFVIGPAIIVRTPNESNLVAVADQNITVMGFGFTPSIDADKNVTVGFWDANGTMLQAGVNVDLNIYDSAHKQVAWYHAATDDVDTNDAVMDVETFINRDNMTSDWNGIAVFPDANGEFDINITIPPMSSGVVGRADLNTLRARADAEGDVNAYGFVIGPNLTMAEDINATVTIAGRHYDLNVAIKDRKITDLENVGATNDQNFTIRLGRTVNVSEGDQLREAVIRFNSDINLANAAVRNYTTDMNGRMGRVEIDTDTLTEYNVDANVFLYNVRVATAQMPFLSKDGIVCPTNVCTNQDGTALSEGNTDAVTGVKTWSYNADAGDGNMAFRVNGFSIFEITSLTLEVLTPSPGEKIRIPRHGADENYAITFRFKDLNVQDNNLARVGNYPMEATIYYSVSGGAKTGVIIRDLNLFDTHGIRCGNAADYSSETFGYYLGETISSDVNLATWNTCQYDLNRSDLNIFGEFTVDVNVMARWGAGFFEGTDLNRSVIAYVDGNVFFNPPLIEITDANFATENFVINYAADGIDLNYVIDFNIYLPDINGDQNFTLGDYNIHFYLSSSPGGTTQDLNIGNTNPMMDQNFTLSAVDTKWTQDAQAGDAGFVMSCFAPPTGLEFLDYDCNAQFDVNWIWDKKYYLVARIMNNKTKAIGLPSYERDKADNWVDHTIDVNELWDINSTKFAFTINDDNKPRCLGVTTSGFVNGREWTFNTQCDDNSSGISNYYFKSGAEDWVNNGTETTKTFTVSGTGEVTKTFSVGVKDYAGNISDMNTTRTVTFRLGGSSQTQTQSPGGPAGPGGVPSTGTEAGTETLVETEQEAAPPTEGTVQSTLEEAGLSQGEIDAAKAIATKTNVGQSVKVEKTTSSTGAVSYRTTVTVKVKNNTAKKWNDVKVVVKVPKALASNASEVTSSLEMNVLKSDPIIEFTVPAIMAGQTYDLVYTVASSVSETIANNMPVGLVTAYAEAVPCEGVVCPEEPCRTGACNPGTELCEYENKADGTPCGDNMECKAGTCVEKAAPPAPPTPPEPPAQDYTTTVIVVVVVVILAAIGLVYYTKGRKKGK